MADQGPRPESTAMTSPARRTAIEGVSAKQPNAVTPLAAVHCEVATRLRPPITRASLAAQPSGKTQVNDAEGDLDGESPRFEPRAQ
jgi:hypothetical protein